MKTLLLALLLAAISSPLSAQDPPTQMISFFAYQTVEVPTTIYLRTGPKKFTALELPGANATPAVHIINPKGQIGIFGPPEKNAAGEELHPRLGGIQCNPAWPKAFAIISSVKQDERTVFTGHAFAVSNNDFPEGSIKVANLSPARVRGKLGKQQVTLKPGEISTVRFQDPAGSLIDVIFQYRESKEANWARMISTRWPVPKNGRRLMFIFPDPRGKGMRAKTIPLRND
ncbi:hypothetical protein [Roseibacillus persicicus]|uniref:hypothetical protein n=1 Tax=Roseibacillus persicicus TaxID=454148 RepID=UPI00281037FC|nr:hypothetical protein [Roseibacillus persicicus]MDQ8190499.1 hypothetical protein [Roseibacillus persicicus]